MWLKSIKENKTSYLYWGYLFIIGFIFYILNLYTPLSTDDFHYHFIFGSKEPINSLTDIIESQYNHYFILNGRTIPHCFAQLFNGIAGKFTFNFINSIVFILFLHLLRINTNNKNDISIIIFISISIFIVSQEFGECYVWMTGACNYLWSATLWLILHSIMFSTIILKIPKILLFVIGIFCGWTHEGIIIGVCIGYFIYFSKNHTDLSIRRIYLLSGLYVGALLLVLSPGSINRASNQMVNETHIINYLLPILQFKNNYIFIFTLLLSIYYYIKQRSIFLKFLNHNLFYLISLIACISFIILIQSGSTRSHFGIELFSFIILFKLTSIINIKQTYFNCLVIASIIMIIPILSYAKDNYQESLQLINQLENPHKNIIATNEIRTNKFIDKYLVKTYISEFDEFYVANQASSYVNIDIAKKYNKDSIIFLPERFIKETILYPSKFRSFNIPSDLPFYAKEINNVNFKKVKYILSPTNFEELPFYIKPFAHKLQRYTINELESDLWNIISINNKNYLLVRKNWAIDKRLKDIIIE